MATPTRSRTTPYVDDRLPMSAKQLYNSVKNGQKLTLAPFDHDEVVGYLAGIDDEHYFILEPTQEGFNKRLVNRANNSVCTIHEPYSFSKEQFRDEMDEVIHKFRTWVLRNVFGQKSRNDAAESNFEGVAS